MYKAFIEPDLQTAHIKIINKFNPFTGFQNPTYILKVIISNSYLYMIVGSTEEESIILEP